MKRTPISINRYLGRTVTQKFTKSIQINVTEKINSRDWSRHLNNNGAWNNSMLNIKVTHGEKAISDEAAHDLYVPQFTNVSSKCSYINQSLFNQGFMNFS